MKKLMFMFILIIFISCGNTTNYSKTFGSVQAEILTINKNILTGNIYSAFLSSPDGKISNDIIKVGTNFVINDILFLEDFELQHAELAYYANCKRIPIDVYVIIYDSFCQLYKLEFYINGRFLKRYKISFEKAKCLYNEKENLNERIKSQ